MHHFLAIDLGAESGRALLGSLDGDRFESAEVHRFANEPVRLAGTLTWDLPRIVFECRRGIARAVEHLVARSLPPVIDSVSVDSWGVDFGLLDASGNLLQNPVHYRDERTLGLLKDVDERLGAAALWAETGIQSLEINTLYQLVALERRQPEILRAAACLLPMADLVAHFLGARPAAEVSLASTTQLLSARERDWSVSLLGQLGFDRGLFPEIVDSGSVTGELAADICSEAGLAKRPAMVAAASHDTAAAVAAVPALPGTDWAYLSSGTWSLLGVELDAPCLSEEARTASFTNEAGVGGTTRFLSVITGLWLIQECRREWQRGGEKLSYEELARMAAAAPPSPVRIDPTDPEFVAPGGLPDRWLAACQRAGGPAPASRGELVRCILESLATTHAAFVESAARVTGRSIERLHVVGGGSRHELLLQLMADALGRTVLAGPVEATALGSLLLQAHAMGRLPDRASVRGIVRENTTLREYLPS